MGPEKLFCWNFILWGKQLEKKKCTANFKFGTLIFTMRSFFKCFYSKNLTQQQDIFTIVGSNCNNNNNKLMNINVLCNESTVYSVNEFFRSVFLPHVQVLVFLLFDRCNCSTHLHVCNFISHIIIIFRSINHDIKWMEMLLCI